MNMAAKDREKWDAKYASAENSPGCEPSDFLVRSRKFLKPPGRALDLAGGAGRNAVYLASLGYETDLIDISPVGSALACRLADQFGVRISVVIADLETHPLPENRYDVAVCFNYLQRDLVEPMKKSLRPGGIVVFQTFTFGMRKEFLLLPGELPDLFQDFHLLLHEESGNNLAGIVASKPE